MTRFIQMGGAYYIGIGIERALPGGPIPWWVWVIAGVLSLASPVIARVLRLSREG